MDGGSASVDLETRVNPLAKEPVNIDSHFVTSTLVRPSQKMLKSDLERSGCGIIRESSSRVEVLPPVSVLGMVSVENEELKGAKMSVSVVPSTQLQVELSRDEDSTSGESGGLPILEGEDDTNILPLSSFNRGADWSFNSSDWVLRKVDEIRSLVGISCEGYEEQFKAFLIAIEAGHPVLARSAFKRRGS